MTEEQEKQYSHRNLANPARNAEAITPDDAIDLSQPTRALYVGGAGDVDVILVDDSTAVTFKAVPAGTLLPVQAIRVKATLTTAVDIVGIY